MESDGDNAHLIARAEKVPAQRYVCRAFERAPHVLVTGTSTVAMFDENLQVMVAGQVMDGFPEYSLMIPVRPKNPQEVWDASCSSRLGVFGPPLKIQMDEGGEWNNELRAELRSKQQIKLLSQGAGAHPWILVRHNGPGRGICNRLREGDRLSGKQILAEAQWRLNTLISGGGFPGYQMVFGSNPADLHRWEDKDEDSTCAQDTS